MTTINLDNDYDKIEESAQRTVNSSSRVEELKKFQWIQVERRNPKSIVIQSSKPGSANKDLRKFVRQNQLQYKKRFDDSLADLENMFDDLKLEDEELLERAQRRDLPISIQQLIHKSDRKFDLDLSVPRSDFPLSIRKLKKPPTILERRSVMPNVIMDDYAFRRYKMNNPNSLKKREWPETSLNPGKDQNFLCYMWLDTYDDSNKHRSKQHDDNADYNFECGKEEKEPNLIDDDLLNRRIKQSSAANVLPRPPPFGIPNSPHISFLHVSSDSNYSRAQSEKQKRRFWTREKIPHLVNDDMAFRHLRKDTRDNLKFDGFASNLGQSSTSSYELNIDVTKLRQQLRPVKQSYSSFNSLTSDCSSTSSSDPISPTI